MGDPYLQQLLSDLKISENLLRHAIENRHNPFAENGEQRLIDCQANVNRLHELIRSHKAAPLITKQKGA